MSSDKRTQDLAIDFMYIDLKTCGRCLGTEDALDAAVVAARPALDMLGVRLDVTKTLIESTQQAAELKFGSSPTIRIGGGDIAGALKESNCGDCGDVCGEDTDCRVWSWRGEDHTAAPTGLLVEAILQAAISPAGAAVSNTEYEIPENLRRFFAGKKEREIESSSDKPASSPCSAPTGSTSSSCGC